MKKCKICTLTLPKTDFYSNGGAQLKPSCKQCFNTQRYSYKRPWDLMTQRNIDDIKRRIEAKQKKGSIARAYGISTKTLYKWRKAGKFN